MKRRRGTRGDDTLGFNEPGGGLVWCERCEEYVAPVEEAGGVDIESFKQFGKQINYAAYRAGDCPQCGHRL